MSRLEGLQKIASSDPNAMVPWEDTDEMIPVHKAIKLQKAKDGFVDPPSEAEPIDDYIDLVLEPEPEEEPEEEELIIDTNEIDGTGDYRNYN